MLMSMRGHIHTDIFSMRGKCPSSVPYQLSDLVWIIDSVFI